MTDTLGVIIVSNEKEVRVGTLVRDEADMMSFEIDRSYIELGESRPILSSSVRFLGDEERTVEMLQSGTITQPGRDLHPWFSNLLPEGALRDLVNKGLPAGERQTSTYLRTLATIYRALLPFAPKVVPIIRRRSIRRSKKQVNPGPSASL